MSSETPVRRSSGGGRMLLFLVGLVLGAVLAVAVLALDVLPFAGDGDDAGAAASPTPDDTSGTPTATGDVPASCAAAAEYNATVSTAMDEVAVGVRDQDALAVEKGLDAIADIKPDMDAASAECRRLAGTETAAPADESAEGSGDDSAESSDESTADPTDAPSATPTP